MKRLFITVCCVVLLSACSRKNIGSNLGAASNNNLGGSTNEQIAILSASLQALESKHDLEHDAVETELGDLNNGLTQLTSRVSANESAIEDLQNNSGGGSGNSTPTFASELTFVRAQLNKLSCNQTLQVAPNQPYTANPPGCSNLILKDLYGGALTQQGKIGEWSISAQCVPGIGVEIEATRYVADPNSITEQPLKSMIAGHTLVVDVFNAEETPCRHELAAPTKQAQAGFASLSQSLSAETQARSAEIASMKEELCEEMGGTFENGTCTPGNQLADTIRCYRHDPEGGSSFGWGNHYVTFNSNDCVGGVVPNDDYIGTAVSVNFCGGYGNFAILPNQHPYGPGVWAIVNGGNCYYVEALYIRVRN